MHWSKLAGLTSVAPRSTLGRGIALAYVRPSQVQPGTDVKIRVDTGRYVTATVAALPFYDPGGERQK